MFPICSALIVGGPLLVISVVPLLAIVTTKAVLSMVQFTDTHPHTIMDEIQYFLLCLLCVWWRYTVGMTILGYIMEAMSWVYRMLGLPVRGLSGEWIGRGHVVEIWIWAVEVELRVLGLHHREDSPILPTRRITSK